MTKRSLPYLAAMLGMCAVGTVYAGGACAAGAQAVVPGAACPEMTWPREAQRYEIEGTTTLSFSVDRNGKAVDVSVNSSAGWRILDDAARSILAACVFDGPRRDAVYGPVQFVWQLKDDALYFHPLPLPGSCAPSTRFARFQPFDKTRSDARGIVLRMLVNPDGTARNVVAEAPAAAPELVAAAIAFAYSCKYGVAAQLQGQRTDTVFGKVIVANP